MINDYSTLLTLIQCALIESGIKREIQTAHNQNNVQNVMYSYLGMSKWIYYGAIKGNSKKFQTRHVKNNILQQK
jgi:hypothetical protein